MTRILVADDNPDVLESTSVLLEVLGFDVVGVAGAREIQPAAHAARPDVILQDVQMPGLDLADTVRRIRADPATATTAILLFTADATADELADAVGADGIVIKPFDGDQIKAVLDRAAGQGHHA